MTNQSEITLDGAFSDLAARLFPARTGRFFSQRYTVRHALDVSFALPAKSGGALAILFHGGGWTKGSAERNIVLVAPLLAAGWATASVSYRLAAMAPAPGALEDALDAVDHCFAVSDGLGINSEKVVLFGVSAGGHLALCAGLAPDLLGERRPRPPVAAVVNLYGVADPSALLADHVPFASQWFDGSENPGKLAADISPARRTSFADRPAVFTAHGTEDTLVPASQSVALHARLSACDIDNELLLVPGSHGHFELAARSEIFRKMESFLRKRDLWSA